MIGTYVLSHGYYDAYYLQAQKLRRMIADDFQAAFQVCDVIAGPVSPTVARPIAADEGHQADPVAEYLADIFTLPASLAALATPAPLSGLRAQSTDWPTSRTTNRLAASSSRRIITRTSTRR